MSGKKMSDEEYINYMNEHYINNNEKVEDIIKDLKITKSYFYKRNKELNIKKGATIIALEEEKKTEEVKKIKKKENNEVKFDFLSGKFKKGNINLN